jgi:hypothetical protein
VASGKEPYNDDDGDDTYDADQKTQRGYCKSSALVVLWGHASVCCAFLHCTAWACRVGLYDFSAVLWTVAISGMSGAVRP